MCVVSRSDWLRDFLKIKITPVSTVTELHLNYFNQSFSYLNFFNQSYCTTKVLSTMTVTEADAESSPSGWYQKFAYLIMVRPEPEVSVAIDRGPRSHHKC